MGGGRCWWLVNTHPPQPLIPNPTLGIAVGSSIQIVLFVVPLCVVVGWAMGQPMSLDFHAFETTALVLSCIMVNKP